MHNYLTAELSASAVSENLRLLRSRLRPPTLLCAVVKANCYGLGVELLLDTISRQADWLAVAAPVEAIQVRDLGYGGPLLVLFSCCAYAGKERQEALEELIRRRATLTVASADDIEPIALAALQAGLTADVHIKMDSGMGRSGVAPHEATPLAEAIRAAAGLRLAGLYTHFATAGAADEKFMHEQLRRFRQAVETVPRRGELLLHAAASAAAIGAPQTHLDMVRCGLAVYGYQPADRCRDPLPLRPALRLWAPLMQIKPLAAGSAVGYGLTRKLDRPSTVGLVPIGYGDGYLRSLSNCSAMRIGGQDVATLGRISMDQTIIDLTDVPGAKVGDPVEIISPDPAAPCSLENLARLAGTIPYEIICRLGGRVRRVLVQ